MADNIRIELNKSDPNRTDPAGQEIGLGDAINTLITQMTATETGVSPSSDVATLAAAPSYLWQINATAGTVTGIKKLILGRFDGTNVLPIPATGEAVWDGATRVRFAAADAVSAASFTYATSADVTASILQRSIGEKDPT